MLSRIAIRYVRRSHTIGGYYTPNEAVHRVSWEPHPDVFDGLGGDHHLNEYSLTTLIRKDIEAARKLFVNVLFKQYSREPGMYAKWGVMEWKAGHPSTARRIFTKGSKVQYNSELWQVRTFAHR